MRSARNWLPWLALGLCGCAGGAPGAEGSGISRASIAGGSLDVEHAAVFELLVRWGDNQIGSCTATLIAPNLLVTARHCISPGDHDNIVCGMAELGAAVSGGNVYATNDPTPGAGTAYYGGADVRVPPDNSDTCGGDIALVMLDQNVPAAQATPVIPRIDRDAEPGEPYVAIGYGVNEEGRPNQGRMLRGDLEVRCSTDCDRRYQVVAREFLGETGVCSGDSGGPALDAQGKVIGVVSRGSDPCSTPIYGSVAGWRDWIVETAFDAAALGGYRAPFWAWSGSSDLADGLVGEGSGCQSSGECEPGLVCYFASDPADASCSAVCENDEQCSAPQRCVPGFDVRGGGLCLTQAEDPPGGQEPPGSAGASSEPGGSSDRADDGCSVRGRPTGSDGLLWLVAVAMLVGFRWSRRGSNVSLSARAWSRPRSARRPRTGSRARSSA
jgi:hypothetical protein